MQALSDSLVFWFFSLFYVCFKCKIRFRTYGIHHNIKIWTKNFTIPRDYEGGGGPDPFIVKDYEKGPFFLKPSLRKRAREGGAWGLSG